MYDDYVIRGNTAVIRCHLPSFVREYVTIDSWLRDEENVLKSTDIGGSFYVSISIVLVYEFSAAIANWATGYLCGNIV